MKILKSIFIVIALCLLSSSAFATGAFYASSQVVTTSSTGNVINLIGVGTNWVAQTFSVSGGTSPSITAQVINSTTSATITLSSGSAAGALTISDGSLTTSIYSESPNWGNYVADTYNRADTVPGTPGTTSGAGNNWKDVFGGVYNISSNALIGTPDTTNLSQNYLYDQLTRPTSEKAIDSRIVYKFVYASSTPFSGWDGVLRSNGLTGSSFAGYLVQSFSNTTPGFAIYGPSGGSAHQIQASTPTMVNGNTYQVDFSVWNSNHTSYLAILTNITTGTILSSLTGTDSSDVGPQVSGYYGLTVNDLTAASTPQPLTYISTSTFFNQIPATTYTFTGPTGGLSGSPSSNFTVTAIGYLASTVTITPSDSAGGGTFTPSTVTLAIGNNSSATFTYTNAAANTYTISTTNSASLTNPSSVSYNNQTGINVTDTNIFFSPYNWFSNGSGTMQSNNILPGSTYAQTVNPGAYIKMGFSGTSISVNIDPSNLVAGDVSASLYPTLYYTVDSGTAQTHLITATDGIVSLKSGLASGNHTLQLWFKSTNNENIDRWNTPTNLVKIDGFLATSSVTPTLFSKRAIFYGDSITEGVRVNSNTGVETVDSDATRDYAENVAFGLSAEYGNIGFGAQGLQYPTGLFGGNVPMMYNATDASQSWNKYYAGTSRLAGGLFVPAPDYIFCNMGTNDGSHSINTATFQAAVTSWLQAVRAAAPNAKIFWILPFGNFYSTYIQNGVTNAADHNVFVINIGVPIAGLTETTGASWLSFDGTHPTAQGHARFASAIVKTVQADISGSMSSSGGGQKMGISI